MRIEPYAHHMHTFQCNGSIYFHLIVGKKSAQIVVEQFAEITPNIELEKTDDNYHVSAQRNLMTLK